MLSTAQPGHPWCTNWGLPTLFQVFRWEVSGLGDVAAVDLQVAVSLLCMCGSFCRMASDALSSFATEVKQCAQPSMLPMAPGARHSLDHNLVV